MQGRNFGMVPSSREWSKFLVLLSACKFISEMILKVYSWNTFKVVKNCITSSVLLYNENQQIYMSSCARVEWVIELCGKLFPLVVFVVSIHIFKPKVSSYDKYTLITISKAACHNSCKVRYEIEFKSCFGPLNSGQRKI